MPPGVHPLISPAFPVPTGTAISCVYKLFSFDFLYFFHFISLHFLRLRRPAKGGVGFSLFRLFGLASGPEQEPGEGVKPGRKSGGPDGAGGGRRTLWRQVREEHGRTGTCRCRRMGQHGEEMRPPGRGVRSYAAWRASWADLWAEETYGRRRSAWLPVSGRTVRQVRTCAVDIAGCSPDRIPWTR